MLALINDRAVRDCLLGERKAARAATSRLTFFAAETWTHAQSAATAKRSERTSADGTPAGKPCRRLSDAAEGPLHLRLRMLSWTCGRGITFIFWGTVYYESNSTIHSRPNLLQVHSTLLSILPASSCPVRYTWFKRGDLIWVAKVDRSSAELLAVKQTFVDGRQRGGTGGRGGRGGRGGTGGCGERQ